MSQSPRLLNLPDPRKEPVRRDFDERRFDERSFNERPFSGQNFDERSFGRQNFDERPFNNQNLDNQPFGRQNLSRFDLDIYGTHSRRFGGKRFALGGEMAQKKQSDIHWLLRFCIEFAIALAIAFVLTWLVKTFIAQPYEVPSGSMQPTIMIGDRIIAEKLSYAFGSVERGDIVVFKDKTQPGRILVKRVIALAGQTVDLRDGYVVIDGVRLYEPYTHGSSSYVLPTTFNNMEITYPYTIPEGHLWVMGDNREDSADSRYFGPIEETAVEGRIFMVFWPFSDISLLM